VRRGRAWASGGGVCVGMVTLGVEEEYLLLDPDSGLPQPGSAPVRAAAELAPTVDGGEVDLELLQAQVEVATPICETRYARWTCNWRSRTR
jgi:gamma-glutamyl:cysteine ligase YbdK (ATP-grasp superfamily)